MITVDEPVVITADESVGDKVGRLSNTVTKIMEHDYYD